MGWLDRGAAPGRDYGASYIDARDYGVKSGTSNDYTSAIQRAITDASTQKVYRLQLPGGRIVCGPITIPKYVTLAGNGGVDVNTSAGSATGPTVLLKPSGAADYHIRLIGDGAGLLHLCSIGESGNSTGGIQIAAGRCYIEDVSANLHGGVGIRLGTDDATNCNLWRLYSVRARSNASHGVLVHSATGPNANGGLLSSGEFDFNGGDGLRSDNAILNTYVALVTQANTGYGINLTENSRDNTFVGGDQNEGNVAGQINNVGVRTRLLGTEFVGFTDTGTFTLALHNDGSKLYRPRFDTYGKGYASGQASTQYTLISEHVGNSSNGRGAGLLLRAPAGSGTARDSAHIAGEQETTNIDKIRLAVNISGTMTSVCEVSGLTNSLIAATHRVNNLGTSTRQWLNVNAQQIRPGAGEVLWTSGTGTPEGSVTAVVGSVYTRDDGGAGTTLYIKESGTGNTGWVAK